MREKLQQIDGMRARFMGKFVRYGKKGGWHGQEVITILLADIKNGHDEIIADHLWFNSTKEFEKITLQVGDMIEFQARVKPYYKGYRGGRSAADRRRYNEFDDYHPIEKDFRLSHPTKIKRIHCGPSAQIQLFDMHQDNDVI